MSPPAYADATDGSGTVIPMDTASLPHVAARWRQLVPSLLPTPEGSEGRELFDDLSHWKDPASAALVSAIVDWLSIDVLQNSQMQGTADAFVRAIDDIFGQFLASDQSGADRISSSVGLDADMSIDHTPPAPRLEHGLRPTGSQTVPTPGTPGYVAYAIQKYYWPHGDPVMVERWAANHQHYAQELTEAADASQVTYGPLFHGRLQGLTGDALQTSLNTNVSLWREFAVDHQNAATALSSAADYLRGLQSEITDIINVNSLAYDSALEQRDIAAANAIAITARQEAVVAVSHGADRISSVLNGKFGTRSVSSDQPTPDPISRLGARR